MQIKLDKTLESIDRIKLELDKEVVDKDVIRQGMVTFIDCISEMGRQIIVREELIEKLHKLWGERNIVEKEVVGKLRAEADWIRKLITRS